MRNCGFEKPIGWIVALAMFAACHSVAVAKPIRVLYEEGADSIGSYCMGALRLALSKIEHNYRIHPVTGARTDARIIEDVRSGELDLLWASANEEIEQTLLPIRIPLYKGLLGHRIFIIRRGDQAKFDRVNSLADLQRLSLGQGTTWADTKILEHNGLSVVRVNKYHGLFYMIDGGRFDAFPRGLQEPWGEIASRPDLELTVEQNLMLVYRMPFYLFVGRDNPQLAADIEAGFNIAIADGSFDQYFYNDPTVQDALTKANIQHRRIIHLQNPALPAKTPVDRPELWLNPAQLVSQRP